MDFFNGIKSIYHRIFSTSDTNTTSEVSHSDAQNKVQQEISESLSGKGSKEAPVDDIKLNTFSSNLSKASSSEREKIIITTFESLLTQAGFNIKSGDDTKKILLMISGDSCFENLLNHSNKDIEKIKKSLEFAIKKFANSDMNKEQKLKNICFSAKAYSMEYVINNRTPEEVEQEKDLDYITKIEKTLGKSFNGTEPTYEDLKEYYNKINTKWNKALRHLNAWRKCNFRYDDNKRGLLDLTKMLRLAETDSLKKNIMLVISEAISDDKSEKAMEYKKSALKAAFMSLSPEAKMEFAEEIHRKGLMEKIMHIKSEEWNSYTETQKRAFIEALEINAEHFSKEYAKEAPKVANDKRLALKKQEEEILNNPSLSEEEKQEKLKKVRNQLSYNTDEQAATEHSILTRNYNVTNEEKLEIAKTYANNLDSDQVVQAIARISQYYENTLSNEQQKTATEILDNATNGNYSAALNNIKNGTSEELRPTTEENQKHIAQNNNLDKKSNEQQNPFTTDIQSQKTIQITTQESQKLQTRTQEEIAQGNKTNTNPFKQTEESVTTNSKEDKAPHTQQNKRKEYSKVEYFLSSAKTTIKDIYEYFKENVVTAIKEVLNSSYHNNYAHQKALDYFSRMNMQMQILTASAITDPKSRKDAYRCMSITALSQVEGNNYYAEQEKEEVLEQKKELNGQNKNYLYT